MFQCFFFLYVSAVAASDIFPLCLQGSAALSPDGGGRRSPDTESDVRLLRQVRLRLLLILCLLPKQMDFTQSHTVFVFLLSSAFCKADHGPRLDHFFCLFFQQLIQPSRLRDSSSASHSEASGTLFLDGLPAVRWLTLPPEIKVQERDSVCACLLVMLC